MLLSGETVSPADAVTLGLANDVVPEADVIARAEDMALVVAERSVAASRAIKEALARGQGLDLAAALDVEREIAVRHMSSEDAQRGLAAFKSRSAPDFGYRRPSRSS
jgi:enoyl-CoA hydratase